MTADGRPVDILHDFYIPALSRAVKYDRMAGFFTSSSLAVASQGFSSFTAAGGRMRLIVGADLQAADVAAILQGDEQRLSRSLEGRLDGRESWPEDEARGVDLLAWMVAQDFLEVRVAFRVHSQSREPLPYDSSEDGYMHEKWALFQDGQGHWLMATGSLNESKTALVLNAENISIEADWWQGPSQSRIEDHRRDFTALWADRHPCFRVLTLPEAVRKKLVRMGRSVLQPVEVDGTKMKMKAAPSPLEQARFQLLKMGPTLPGGLYVGMETAPVSPWPHQRVVARRLIDSWPNGHLLCDEVGLGKTIEAGLAFRSLWLSRVAERILIAAPAGLTRQWHREMAGKFFLPFQLGFSSPRTRHEKLLPREEKRYSDGLFDPDLCLVSTGLLQRKERREELDGARPFDVALVDEAHYARRKNPSQQNSCRAHPEFGSLYLAIQHHLKPKTASLWLATATPMQLDWIEAYDLFRLTGRVGPFGASPTMVRAYYDLMAAISDGEHLDPDEWEYLKRAIGTLPEHDPLYWNYLERCFSDHNTRLARMNWFDRGRNPLRGDLRYLKKFLFAAAPLSRVMLRHTRGLLWKYKEEGQLSQNLARRELLPIPPISFTAVEKKAYEDLKDYCRELTAQIERNSDKDEKKRASLGFYLSFLQQRFASSLYAIRESLKRRLIKVQATLAVHEGIGGDEFLELEEESDSPDEAILQEFLRNRTPEDLRWEAARLDTMIHDLRELPAAQSKIQELLTVLERRKESGRIRQTVVFTRYLDTLNDLTWHLRQRDRQIRLGTYSGDSCQFFNPETAGMETTDRESVKKSFLKGEIDVLLCTDAAAEGLNLQTADLLINFDLPWNPMKVEQRVGRIDRIGQKYERIQVLNLCYPGSVEERIYGRLLERLGQAVQMMGNMPFSLLPVEPQEFEQLANGEISERDLERLAKERLALQREQTLRMEMSVEDRFRLYCKLADQWEDQEPPVSLADIWAALVNSDYLRALGSRLVAGNDDRVLELRGIPGITRGTCLTVDRGIYEKGGNHLPGPLHFATYGDPVFDTLLRHVTEDFKLPGGVVTLEVPNGSRPGPVTGLGLAVGNGLRLVTSLADLPDSLETEDDPPEPEALKILEKELARRERTHPGEGPLTIETSERILSLNLRAENAERGAERFLGRSILLSLRALGFTEDSLFYEVQTWLDNNLSGKPHHNIPALELAPLREVASELIWDLNIPQMSTHGDLSIPGRLLMAALDTASREAEAMKVARARLTAGMVADRLKKGGRNNI